MGQPRGRTYRGKIRSRPRFRQSDAGINFSACHARQIFLPLRLVPISQQERPGLPVGNPMRANRSARRQQLLQNNIAFQRQPFMAAIFFGPDHADISGAAQCAAKIQIADRPAICAVLNQPRWLVRGQKRAYLAAQLLRARNRKIVNLKSLHR